MSAITLTRDEAVAVSWNLDLGDSVDIPGNASTSEGCWAAVRQLTLEATIRDCGWWGADDPCYLDDRARRGDGECPESFALSAGAGGPAVVELLPEMYAETTALHAHYVAGNGHEEDVAQALRRVRALEGLAARLGVQIPTEKVTA